MLPIDMIVSSLMVVQTEPVAVEGNQWWVPLLQAGLTALGGLFVFLLNKYGKKLVDLIAEKTGNPFFGTVAQQALLTVLSLYQTEVTHLKKTAKWTPEAKEGLKQRAIDHLKLLLDSEKLNDLAGEMGVDQFLSHQVEAAVHQAKTLGKSAGKAAPPTDPTDG